jgi:hypothetical protein
MIGIRPSGQAAQGPVGPSRSSIQDASYAACCRLARIDLEYIQPEQTAGAGAFADVICGFDRPAPSALVIIAVNRQTPQPIAAGCQCRPAAEESALLSRRASAKAAGRSERVLVRELKYSHAFSCPK